MSTKENDSQFRKLQGELDLSQQPYERGSSNKDGILNEQFHNPSKTTTKEESLSTASPELPKSGQQFSGVTPALCAQGSLDGGSKQLSRDLSEEAREKQLDLFDQEWADNLRKKYGIDNPFG